MKRSTNTPINRDVNSDISFDPLFSYNYSWDNSRDRPELKDFEGIFKYGYGGKLDVVNSFELKIGLGKQNYEVELGINLPFQYKFGFDEEHCSAPYLYGTLDVPISGKASAREGSLMFSFLDHAIQKEPPSRSIRMINIFAFELFKMLTSISFDANSSLEVIEFIAFYGIEGPERIILPPLVRELKIYTFSSIANANKIKSSCFHSCIASFTFPNLEYVTLNQQ